ncbi:hypothetical protein KEJ18_02575 [Candidatus Bathyarchaeota archaeon]|nr:hypothetical protein [Candidatus Bathyarchaeota archaeon]
MKETHWQKGKDEKGVGIPRTSRQGTVPWKDVFHPSPQAVQVHPSLFVHFPQGTLLLSPRRYYYSTSYSWTNYAAQGKDGLWPNFAVDVAKSGEKTSIETFEYLWSADTSLQPPQQFIDATFFYRRRLAELYDLQCHHAFLDYA